MRRNRTKETGGKKKKKRVNWLKGALVMAVVFLASERLNAQTILSGFADVTYQQEENENASFGMGAFEIDLETELSEKATFEGAIVVEGNEVGLGQTIINFMLINENMGLQAGLLDIPFGIDYQVFATPDRKLISPPLTTELIMDGGWADTGLNIYGTLSLLNYNIYVVNGMGEDNGIPVNQPGDNNDEKTIGSRIGLSLLEKLEFGVSYAQGTYLDDNSEDILSRYGCDIITDFNLIEIKGEYIGVQKDISNSDDNIDTGYYLQLLGNLRNNLYGVARFCEIKPDGEDDITRFTLGFGYSIEENILLKIEYQLNNEQPEQDNNIFTTQLVASF